jgi:hypothetical protein
MLRYASVDATVDVYVQTIEQSVFDALNSPFIASTDFNTGNEFSSGDSLALRYHFFSITMSRGLAPPSCRTCTAHKQKSEAPMRSAPLVQKPLCR